MKLLDLKNISMGFGDRTLFDFETLEVWTGDKIGLVGENGSGKTTLLNIILGEIKPLTGNVERNGKWKVFRQFDSLENTEEISGEFMSRWKVNDIYGQENRTYSGGENTRIRLAEVFTNSPDIIILDEPTSNLDIEGIKQLKETLENVESFILISHDRKLLNSLTNRTIEIVEKTLVDFPGNYDEYLQWKEKEFSRRTKEYENYIEEKNRLLKISERQRIKASRMKSKPKNLSNSEIKQREYGAVGKSFGGKEKSFQRAAKHTEKRIEQLEKKEKPQEQNIIRPDFSLTNPPLNHVIIEGTNLTFGYKGSQKLFDRASFTLKRNRRTALIGENGCGKTTLLRLIEKKVPGIRIVPKAKIGIYRQAVNQIDEEKNLLENIDSVSIQKEEINRNVLVRMGFSREQFYNKAKVLSGGEKIKLTFGMLFVSDCNVLLLDEPTNYLDIKSIEAIEQLFLDFEGTMLFVSHDRHFIDTLADEIWIIKNGKIKSFSGNLTEYENLKKRKDKKDENKMVLEMRRTMLLSELSLGIRSKEEIFKELDEVEKKLN
ncbi:ribosomal protection-like ABC-F family protein [Lagierella sp.]|uniref:ribosomal protection-like ABC-F family protein n=1 Tax=Lagierella sp. TaxID=2849657 RepID=UPI00263661AC|nr:ABC-F family ATP-binding cassette domain-containing protein [Lagierella sp.]